MYLRCRLTQTTLTGGSEAQRGKGGGRTDFLSDESQHAYGSR